MAREHLGVETLYAANSVVSADSHCPGWGLLATAGPTENRFLPHLNHEAQGWGKVSRQQPVRGRASSWSRSGRGNEESSSGWVGAVGDDGLEDDTPSTLRDEPML